MESHGLITHLTELLKLDLYNIGPTLVRWVIKETADLNNKEKLVLWSNGLL